MFYIEQRVERVRIYIYIYVKHKSFLQMDRFTSTYSFFCMPACLSVIHLVERLAKGINRIH